MGCVEATGPRESKANMLTIFFGISMGRFTGGPSHVSFAESDQPSARRSNEECVAWESFQ